MSSISNELIVRIHDASRQQHSLQKITGNIALQSMIELIDSLDLDANPRLAKKGSVTDAIEESLAKESETFQFMTKGILIAASEVEELERNRYRLRITDPQLEGILDGGHNTLAAGRHILECVLVDCHGEDKANRTLKLIKTWKDLKTAWAEHKDIIKTHRGAITNALMPIEIISPGIAVNSLEIFQEQVLVINAARNNNAELSVETKANKRGFYEEIRINLDEKLVSSVEWKTNDGGRIKVRDLVALSLIPLSKLNLDTLKPIHNSPGLLFSSKGQCVRLYNSLIEQDEFVQPVKGNIVEITDPSVKSALALMRDFPRLFDLIYELLPTAYNAAGGSFGKINHVMMSGEDKSFSTRYYKKPTDYSYGEGYIYPLIYGVSAIIDNKNGILSWKVDPDSFIKSSLNDVMKSFYSMIQGQNYDPGKLGKASGAYHMAHDMFSVQLFKAQS